ncbi:hypothetical protein BT69DRAFT_1334807 [Atractiella rhizophila]|nr:hypothetical protein BT69DRAFT_1334807 [Atractiella rhizophila]
MKSDFSGAVPLSAPQPSFFEGQRRPSIEQTTLFSSPPSLSTPLPKSPPLHPSDFHFNDGTQSPGSGSGSLSGHGTLPSLQDGRQAHGESYFSRASRKFTSDSSVAIGNSQAVPRWDKVRKTVKTHGGRAGVRKETSSGTMREEYHAEGGSSVAPLPQPKKQHTLRTWSSSENLGEHHGAGVRFQRLVDVVVKKKGTFYGESNPFEERQYYSEAQSIQAWRREFTIEVERIRQVGKRARGFLMDVEGGGNKEEVEVDTPPRKSMDSGLKRNAGIKGRKGRNSSTNVSTSSTAVVGLNRSSMTRLIPSTDSALQQDEQAETSNGKQRADQASTSNFNDAQSRAARLRSQLEPLLLISNLMARYPKPASYVPLPCHAVIMAELARPFLPAFDAPINPSADIRAVVSTSLLPRPDPEGCKVAVDLFEKVCKEFEPADKSEALERWMWCLTVVANCYDSSDSLYAGGLEKIRDTLIQSLLRLIDDSRDSEEDDTSLRRPDTPLAIQSFAAVLIRNLYLLDKQLARLDMRTSSSLFSDLSKTKNILTSLLNRLANGQLIQLNLQSSSLIHWGESHNMTHDEISSSTAEDLCKLSFIEGLIRVGITGEWGVRNFVFHQLLEKHWLPLTQAPPATYSRILNLFSRGCFSLFHRESSVRTKLQNSTLEEDPLLVFTESKNVRQIKRTILAIIVSNTPDTVIAQLPHHVQESTVRLLLSLFIGQSPAQYNERAWPVPPRSELSAEVLEAKGFLEQLWRLGLKDSIAQVTLDIIRSQDQMPLDVVIPILGVLCLGMSEALADEITNRALPAFFDRIASENLQNLSASVTTLLRSLCSRHPRRFYRPLFACASSDNEEKVRANLNILNSLAALITTKEILLKDAEMIVIALMADVGLGAGEDKWSAAILGQGAVTVMLINALRYASADRSAIGRFVIELEARLSVFMQAREAAALLPFSQRILLSTLLLECRLLTRSNRKPLWLARVVNWALSSFIGAQAYPEPKEGNAEIAPEFLIEVNSSAFLEPENSFHWLELLFRKTQRDADHRPRASLVPSAKDVQHSVQLTEVEKSLEENSKKLAELVSSLSRHPSAPILALLVSVYSFLTEDQLARLCPVIWKRFMTDTTPSIFSPASFLFMLCGDKVPTIVEQVVLADMHNESTELRYHTITHLVSAFASRFSVLSQPIADPSKRRPFRIGRQQISFVPLDVGTSQYIPPDLAENVGLHLGTSLPLETRRALIALGWDNEEDAKQSAQQNMKTPISLISVLQLDQVLDGGIETSSSSKPAGTSPGLLRRKSSTGGGQGSGKRRAILVPSIALLLSKLVNLLLDADQTVASAAREAVTIFARDDPMVFLRPVFEDLSADSTKQIAALTLIRRLTNAQANLPPAFVYHLFNHLAGYLRANLREGKADVAPKVLGDTLPVAARLLPELNGFNVLSLRKNKVEIFYLPSGAFWFTDPAPEAPMFPRTLPSEFEFVSKRLGVPKQRTARDAYLYKKLIGVLELAQGNDLPKQLGDADFVPRLGAGESSIASSKVQREEQDLRGVSLVLARSWLVALIRLLSALNRIFNSRPEMATIMDTVNRILLVHGNDSNVVALALRVCLLASTRFRRLFSSSNGFQLCFPAIFKTFCESKQNQAIRLGIMYTFRRFYQHHEESFVFQAFGAVTPLFASAIVSDEAKKVMARDLFLLLRTLSSDHRESAVDILGLHNANAKEEQEALINIVNDKPEVFLAPLIGTKEEENSAERIQELAKEKDFPIENSIKLFFTVVAFQPQSGRAGDFLFLFRLLVPAFYNSSGDARKLLKEGIEALSAVFSKPSAGRARFQAGETPVLQTSDPAVASVGENPQDDTHTWLTMRRLFLLAVATYYECGGTLNGQSMRRILDLLRAVLKDSTESVRKAASTFMTGYTASIFGEGMVSIRHMLAFLRDVSPLFASQANKVDFSSLLDALCHVVKNIAEQEPDLGNAISNQFVLPAIEACSIYASEGGLYLPIQASTIRLVSLCLTWLDNDVFGMIEKQDQSSGFLARFIFPLALELPSAPATSKDLDAVEERLRKAWASLASYVLTAWKSISSNPTSTSKGAARPSSFTILLAIQILKVIIVRGERFLSLTPGSWQSMASFLRENLHKSGAKVLNDLSSGQPRTLDYAFFSLAELLSLYRSPLMLHLRPFIREKLIDCRLNGRRIALSDFSRNSVLGKTANRTSAFSKPLLGRSLSTRSRAVRSPTQSPSGSRSASPVGSRAPSRRPSVTGLLDQHMDFHKRKPSFDLFSQNYLNLKPEPDIDQQDNEEVAASPTVQGTATSRIRHLGPQFLFNEALRSSGSQRQKKDEMILATFGIQFDRGVRLRGTEMAAAVLQKIQNVQIIFGEPVLESDGGKVEDVESWTTNEAIAAAVEETRIICNEFGDVLSGYGSEGPVGHIGLSGSIRSARS